MGYINLNGASFNADFVRGFETPEAFIESQEGNIPDWEKKDRKKDFTKVWNQAKGKPEKAKE
jgi:hypothetical protein